jgi:hypothetical protein
VKHCWTTPFWLHIDLYPLEDSIQVKPDIIADSSNEANTTFIPENEDFQDIDDLPAADMHFVLSRATFDQSVNHRLSQLCDFVGAFGI